MTINFEDTAEKISVTLSTLSKALFTNGADQIINPEYREIAKNPDDKKLIDDAAQSLKTSPKVTITLSDGQDITLC